MGEAENDKIKEEYDRRTEELINDEANSEKRWKEMTGVMITVAREVCGMTRSEVANT